VHLFKSIVMGATIASIFFSGAIFNSAYAEMRVEQKLFQIGGPETRTRCIKELKTKGLPSCSVHGWELKCDDTWIVTCSEWATDFMQHEVFLVAAGPDAEQALQQVLRNAVTRATAAAVLAAAAAPGEVVARTAAAIVAFKTTLVAELAVEPALASIQNQFNMSIQQREFW
jgi:hypothetical protein